MKKAVIFDMYGVLLLKRYFFTEKEHLYMTQVVAELREKGYQLFLLSNIYLSNGKHFIEKYPFLSLFTKVYFSADTGFYKPDPRAYKQVLEENNLKPEECIFFDDTKRNVRAAQKLGIEAYEFENPQQVRRLLGI